ncbi:MAG: DUF1800 family protein [Marinovum sp.]|nr:DUF1800 family protein [Marinovum sp.]
MEKRVQTYLNLTGYNVGRVDGIIGPKTRQSINAAYNDAGLKFDNLIDEEDLSQLRQIYFDKSWQSWRNDYVLSKVMDVADARHFLERTGIGSNPLDIQQLVGATRADAVHALLSQMDGTVQTPLPNFVFENGTEYWIRGDYDEPGRQSFRVARDREISQFRTWWVSEMIETTKPQNERLLLFWTDHFPVGYSAINEESLAIAKQHLMFRQHGFGNFKTLIKAIIRDPAMLNYLNGENNNKKAPNENLARELMELFVLGEGAYDEKTVKEAARALTGKSINRIKGFEYYLYRRRHDRSVKMLFGKKGHFDGDDLIDILFQQPTASRFLTEKLWSYYVSETEQNQSELEQISQSFRKSNFEIPVLLAEIFSTPSFWADQTRGTIVKSPVDLIIGTMRTTGYLPIDWQSTGSAMANLGQNLFEPPNIAGWSRGAGWVTPASLLNRTKFVTDFFAKEGFSIADLATDSPEMMLNRPDKIIVRYGAENFEGPPKFVVKLQKKKAEKDYLVNVWRSDVITAKGGHDTGLFGRIERSEIPWMVVDLDHDPTIDFDTVAVEFTNDHCCGPGGSDSGDRNLFIEWVKVGRTLFLAQDGKQVSGCKNGNRNPGLLYCSGMVKMSQGENITQEKTAPSYQENQLVVERAAFFHGNEYNPNKGWNEISLGLLNVNFNHHWQSGMRVNLIVENNSEIFLEINDLECSDNCIQGRWPKSAHDERSGQKFIRISLGPQESRQTRQQFEELSKQDKFFVSALWQALPDLLVAMQSGNNFNRRNGKEVTASWKNKLSQIDRRLRNSRYVIRYPVPGVIIAKDTRKKADGMMAMAMSAIKVTPPVPASHIMVETDTQWEQMLNEMFLEDDIAKAVLAMAPIFVSLRDQPMDLITDPVYHLK